MGSNSGKYLLKEIRKFPKSKENKKKKSVKKFQTCHLCYYHLLPRQIALDGKSISMSKSEPGVTTSA